MIHPDERAARCMLHLRAPEFQPLVAYWRVCLAEAHKRLVETQDKDQMLRLQGDARTYAEILKGIDQADDLLLKLKR